MAEAVSLAYNLSVKATHTLPLSLETAFLASDPSIALEIINGTTYNIAGTLNASSSAPATKVIVDEITLSSGAATIDLTSLTGFAATSVTMSGLKVQAIILSTASTNTHAVTFVEGASNGYEMLGNAFSITMGASGKSATAAFILNEGAPDVSASAKTIDVSSTHQTAKFALLVVCG